MKTLGFKNLLLISTLSLVVASVTISSLISYHNEKTIITKMVQQSSTSYVTDQAKAVESLILDKVGAIDKLSSQFKSEPLTGTSDEIIQLTKIMASAANLESATISFESGDGYWSQTASDWPDHQFSGDVTTLSWYQAGRNANTVSVTDPYLSSSGENLYWISIVNKISNGVVTVDMPLGFLNESTSSATKLPGSVAFIMSGDTTVLATSADSLKIGQQANELSAIQGTLKKILKKEKAMVDYDQNGVSKIMFSQRIQAGDKNWYFVLGVDKSVAFAALDDAKYQAALVAILASVFSLIAAFFIVQLLYRPILQLKSTILDLAQGEGDLTQRLAVKTNDDLGQIAEGVNHFVSNLQQLIIRIQGASDQLQDNAERLKGKSSRNASILSSHVSETEQIVTAIEEMNATADAMASDAANTAQLTQQANAASDQSQTTVKQAQDTVSALVEEVDETGVNVQQMSDRTNGINQILGVIGEIAEQTNLLALNAAIEAARAGEQGRGFAVVADEVRSLASRTKESTEEIEMALSSLLKGNQSVVNAMDTTKQRCQDTASGMGQVTESLNTMTHFVGDINDLSSQIATAAEEQSNVTQEVSRNMTAISEIVSELDNNGNETLEDAARISEVSSELSKIVSRFKV